MGATSKTPIPVVELIGDKKEIFYQLGLKDKENFFALYEHIRSVLSVKNKFVDKVIDESLALLLKKGVGIDQDFEQLIRAYAEGLDQPFEKVAFALLIPELVSSLSKWLPSLPVSIFGCSSYFTLDHKNHTSLHGRILDFPMNGTYDNHERMLIMKPTNQYQICSLGTVGLPYPSLTGFNDQGMTLAIHQKFTDVFNINGQSIFHICFNLLLNCNSKESVLEYLNTVESITTWCINLTFNNGDAITIDIAGKKITTEEFKLEVDHIEYLNNELIDEAIDQSSFIPYGMNDYNRMRKNKAYEIINAHKKEIDGEELLKLIATPSLHPSGSKKQFNLSPLNTSSVQISVMDAIHQKLFWIPGPAPKVLTSDFYILEDVFGQRKWSKKTNKRWAQYQKYQEGLKELGLTQTAFDKNNMHDAYHHNQMAIHFLKGHYEQYIAEFYFIVVQFLHDPHEKVREKILHELEMLTEHLSGHLRDNAILFRIRLMKLMKLTEHSGLYEMIENPHLKKLAIFEKRIPNIIHYQMLKHLTVIRIEILDILYAFAK